jgi:hypothetical protein
MDTMSYRCAANAAVTLVELAALFVATGVADLFVSTLSHNQVGPQLTAHRGLHPLGGLPSHL